MNIKTSPLIEMASEAKRPTRWWITWLLGVVFIYGGLIVGDLLGEAILRKPMKNAPVHQFVDFFGFGMIVFFVFLWMRLKEKRSFSSVGFRGGNPVGKLAIGWLIGAGMMTVGVLVPWAMGQYQLGASEHGRLGISAILWLIPLLFLFILQGSTEEIVLRGYMLQMTGRQVAAPIAIFGTSLIFSALHHDYDPVPFINIVLYAIFACYVALADGSLWRICGLHAGWNYFQGNIFGLPVSGNPEGTSLLNFGPARGSIDLITGGNFGVEASLVGTAVLLISLGVAIAYYRKQESRRALAAQQPLPQTEAAAA